LGGGILSPDAMLFALHAGRTANYSGYSSLRRGNIIDVSFGVRSSRKLK
jgi:hypothetical protein